MYSLFLIPITLYKLSGGSSDEAEVGPACVSSCQLNTCYQLTRAPIPTGGENLVH